MLESSLSVAEIDTLPKSVAAHRGSPTASTSVAGFELHISRVFDAPRELVWAAWTDPALLGEWMGPRGFTAMDIEHDVRVGGKWRLRLHKTEAVTNCDPKGQPDLWMRGVYLEVVPPLRAVYTFAWEGRVDMPALETTITVTFRELEGKTVMDFRQGPFLSAEDRDGHNTGWSSAFDRFAEFLLTPVGAENTMTNGHAANKYDLVLERVFDAPRAAVWSAWTDPAQLAEWWGPKRFTNPVCRAETRAGGAIYIEMRAPDGTVYPMSGTYLEVVKPERIVFTSAALDDHGQPKFEMHTTIAFADLGGKTALKLVARVLKMTSADAPQHLAGMREGWSQSLDRLAERVKNRDAELHSQSK